MAQFIRSPFDMDFNGVQQVSQVVYHNERLIEIDYDINSNRAVIQNNGEWFWLSSPDIEHLTIRHILQHLGIANEQIVITSPNEQQIDVVLDTTVNQAPLNQIAVYPHNQPIPQIHNRGPFPVIVGQPAI